MKMLTYVPSDMFLMMKKDSSMDLPLTPAPLNESVTVVIMMEITFFFLILSTSKYRLHSTAWLRQPEGFMRI